MKKAGCRDLGIPCDHEETGDDTDDLEERLVRHIVVQHGRRGAPELRRMVKMSVREFQRQVGR